MHKRALARRSILAWSVVIALAATRLPADEARCSERETPRQCVRLLLKEWTAVVQGDLAKANNGVGSVSSPLRSSSKDFLSVASAHLDTPVSEDGHESLALTYTVPVAFLGTRQQVQVEVIVNESNLDDVRATLSFNPATRRFGRSIVPHTRLFESMLLALITPAYGEDFGGIAWTSFDKPFDAIVDDPATRAEVIRGFETTTRSDLPPAAAELVADFTTLLGNQPQIYASGLADDGKDLLVPPMRRAMLTWELGTRNLNDFRTTDGKSCQEGAGCADAFERYVTRTAATNKGRLSFSLAYDRILESIAGADTPYAIPESAGLVYSAAYGLTFASPLKDRDGRLDLTLTYDGTKPVQTGAVTSSFRITSSEVTASPRFVPRSYDRYILAATYTQKLSDRVQVPLSLVWSERSESLPGACTSPVISPPIEICEPPVTTTPRDFTVHLGLTYTIPPRAPERIPRHSRYCCG